MKILFNEDWKYKEDGGEWKNIHLPHDAMLLTKRASENKSGSAGAYFGGNSYTYKKEFEITDTDKKHISFEFGGVYKNARVFINDKEAGGASYGYIPFLVEADDLINEGKNIIRVEAENKDQPDSRWYSGAGIYRDVYMYVKDRDNYILPNGIKIKTLSYENPAKILVSVSHRGGSVLAAITDKENKTECVNKAVKNDNGVIISEFTFEIKNARPWSADSPSLYSAEVKLYKDGEEDKEACEIIYEDFGIRCVELKKSGLYINGESTKLRGGCLHHDNGVIGAAEFDECAIRKIKILKEYGFNAVRIAHNPASDNLLRACDALGMYVMDETWDMWYRKKSPYDYANDFEENYKDDIRNMVSRDYNHPSVIMYSIGNEVSEPAEERGVKLAKEMTELFHTLDDTRAVTGGFNLMIIGNSAKGNDMYKEEGGRDDSGEKKTAGMNSTMFNMMTSLVGTGMNKAANGKHFDNVTSPLFKELDIAGYNYASGRYKKDGKLHPDRLILGSETFPQDLSKNWEMVKKYPYLIGDFMWTAWDYIGEAGIGAWSYESDAKGFNKPYPWLLADTGAFDILGNPTGEALWARAIWSDKYDTFLAVRPVHHSKDKLIKATWRGTNALPFWSYKDCEGEMATVEVYTKAPYAELYLNGKLLGKKKTKNERAVFRTVYMDGELSANGVSKDGQILGSTSLKTAEKEAGVYLKLENINKPVKDGYELKFVDVRIADKEGRLLINDERHLKADAVNAELLGFGSASPRTEESFTDGEYTTYYGRALAVIRKRSDEKAIFKVKDLTENKEYSLEI